MVWGKRVKNERELLDKQRSAQVSTFSREQSSFKSANRWSKLMLLFWLGICWIKMEVGKNEDICSVCQYKHHKFRI